jgi:DNA invertase Pin-like site-specific DNA recombinase
MADRLARSVRHLTALAAELEDLSVDLVVLDQGVDTSTPAGRLLFHVLGSIAEFERDFIRGRTRAGCDAARRRGSRFGRPEALSPEAIERLRRLIASGKSHRYIASMLSVGKGTVQRECARLGLRAAAA